jgi:hypothetical protein
MEWRAPLITSVQCVQRFVLYGTTPKEPGSYSSVPYLADKMTLFKNKVEKLGGRLRNQDSCVLRKLVHHAVQVSSELVPIFISSQQGRPVPSVVMSLCFSNGCTGRLA